MYNLFKILITGKRPPSLVPPSRRRINPANLMETQTSGCDNDVVVGDDTWRAEAEIGGNERALQALRELIIFPFRYPLEARTLGLKVKKK